MSLLDRSIHSYDEYEKKRNETDEILEYIDGLIYMSPSPSIKHQEISSYLHGELYNLMKNKDNCKVFAAPTDVVLKDNKNDEKKRIVPDLFVACVPDNFTKNEYIGAPDFIIEILSPSNQSHDLITKLNLYMNYGVREYWIVNPMLKNIMIYSLNQKREVQFDLITINDIAISKLFTDFKVKAEELFL